ncbi:MAG: sugar transferase, partial [bacterium]|nr:sugar transferase [bacterium]
IAVLNFVSDPGPIFFRQERITRYGNKFRIFKFRTMYKKFSGTTPEEAFEMIDKPGLAKKYRDQGDQLQRDPRVTPFGRFLRRTSLDELPQLFNVIKGDISLVGPRALIPQEIEGAEGKHRIISVKSGVTGLAQVSGRRNISFEERRKLDVYYVQNWTFWMDVVILFKTIRVIITGSGTN